MTPEKRKQYQDRIAQMRDGNDHVLMSDYLDLLQEAVAEVEKRAVEIVEKVYLELTARPKPTDREIGYDEFREVMLAELLPFQKNRTEKP